ncbi:hypothetical protein [Streptomyces chryseus]|uniref:hypothetical protein n=1 Tax=Streptomyces chryseus TaxID=68186 RepID=UPI00110F7B61|nr:hypothetical protein [Streptomyces chryseus]GGX02026.1 hypothetical protein GCM10010353_17080 [Streptomyces chryseus]
MNRRTRLAHRLHYGSAALARRLGTRTAAWIARGPGQPQRVVRTVLVVVGLYYAARIIRAAPGLLFVLVPAWCIAAVRHAAPIEGEEPAPKNGPETLPADAVRALLFECLGDRDRVHLSTVLAHLQKEGHGEGWTVADLRVRLEALNIPVRPKVKIGGVPTRGVHRDDLTPPSPVADPAASPAASPAA